ncbi:MAG TPA: hypothetical protein VK888_04475 [Anaerolineales bacterium]|nr:hypothetical protein [Anaerolineales bacterium]
MDRSSSKRFLLVSLVAALILFLVLLFWPFVLATILQPIALVLWLLVRILVLSIHQKYFWYVLIFAAVFVLLRLLRQTPSEPPAQASFETNTTLTSISYWRALFLYTGPDVHEDAPLKRQLTGLLTSLYAWKQGTPNDYRIQDSLQQGAIPLPETVQAFLFPQEPEPGRSLKKFLQAIPKAPRRWIRQWTGQAKAEHSQRIEEVLGFLETSLEINDDDRTPT